MELEELTPKSYPTNLLNKDWSKRKCFYRKGGAPFLEKVHDLEVKDDDVWVVTLPKCGTTWMQELVWLVMNSYDFEAAKKQNVLDRSPFLEFGYFITGDLERGMKPVEDLKTPRLIKSHLPLPLLPEQLWSKKPKVIYVYRNPKDAWVSEFYHSRNLGLYMDKTLEEFINDFIERRASQSLPFEHVTEFYALRHQPWLYYTSYECMKSDLRQVIQDICKFLNKSITETQMQQMLRHLSFEEMQNNPRTHHDKEFEQVRKKFQLPYEPHNFIRRGKVGGYRDELSPQLITKVNNWMDQELSHHNLTLGDLLLMNDDKEI